MTNRLEPRLRSWWRRSGMALMSLPWFRRCDSNCSNPFPCFLIYFGLSRLPSLKREKIKPEKSERGQFMEEINLQTTAVGFLIQYPRIISENWKIKGKTTYKELHSRSWRHESLPRYLPRCVFGRSSTPVYKCKLDGHFIDFLQVQSEARLLCQPCRGSRRYSKLNWNV